MLTTLPQTIQHVYNWRSQIGATAIEAVKTYWDEHTLVTIAERAACAQFHLGPKEPYLYGIVTVKKEGNLSIVNVRAAQYVPNPL